MSKKHAVKSIFWLAAGIFGLVLVGGLFTPAQAAHANCGGLVEGPGTVVLDSDVGGLSRSRSGPNSGRPGHLGHGHA